MTPVTGALVSDARFEFGENWKRFLAQVNDARIAEAERSLTSLLDADALRGGRFLDIGCGSGLFSLAARRLGAEVVSFDFDPASVECAEVLRRRYAPDERGWRIERGSVLDEAYMRGLGRFDVVYSWGVLHHTGAMWRAMEAAGGAVGDRGRLFIAIYNDQGAKSRWWRRVKRTYNALPVPLRLPYLLAFGAALETGAVAAALVRLEPHRIIDRWTRYHNLRGMSRWHDIVDWVGGYPFEVASPEAVVDFYRKRQFAVERMRTCGGRMGCNEFVFVRAT
jgi:2-polyprenyl-6-hydroxyphenyl methylase/3-demethylubiquinone-9 3-methyltransferase